MNQPIIEATIEVSDDAFWNWLADEAQIDLNDLHLTGVDANRTTGHVRFHIQRPAPGRSLGDVVRDEGPNTMYAGRSDA